MKELWWWWVMAMLGGMSLLMTMSAIGLDSVDTGLPVAARIGIAVVSGLGAAYASKRWDAARPKRDVHERD